MAMASIEQLLACEKCQERYKDPRKLPCGHTYCLACLQDQDTAQTRLCRLCDEMWTVPASGAFPLYSLAQNVHTRVVFAIRFNVPKQRFD